MPDDTTHTKTRARARCAPAPGPTPAYAELQAVSNFSFLSGGSHPDELAAQAKALGHGAIAIADRNTLAGAVRAFTAGKQVGLRVIVGVRLDLEDAPSLVCLPTDRQAYGRLCRLLSLGQGRAEKGKCALRLADVAAHADGNIFIALAPDGWDWREVVPLFPRPSNASRQAAGSSSPGAQPPDPAGHVLPFAGRSRPSSARGQMPAGSASVDGVVERTGLSFRQAEPACSTNSSLAPSRPWRERGEGRGLPRAHARGEGQRLARSLHGSMSAGPPTASERPGAGAMT